MPLYNRQMDFGGPVCWILKAIRLRKPVVPVFFVYALAYGINQGILPSEKFRPVVEKGWQALVSAVEEDGKLGYVQPIGADPKKVSREMTEVYGVGAFLLTGCEVYKMCR